MAVVYRAEDTALYREVAVKILHSQFWSDPQYLERFGREARSIAAVRHPNIIEIHDFGGGGDDGPAYIVTELIRGSDLGAFLKAHGRLLPEVAVLIVLRIADALAAAHQAGIIHRDVKPENVLIAEGGRVLLTDFGIARMMEGETLTQTGSMVGSPSYMSPEQALGKRVDARSDLFSLAAMLYKMCTGQVPFPGKDPISTVLKIVAGKYLAPIRLNPQIGKELDGIISRMLDADMSARPADAKAVAVEFEAFLKHSGLTQVDGKLGEFFAAPKAFDERLQKHICGSLLHDAQDALRSREFSRALALCDRVLAYDAEHAGALALLTQLSAQQGRQRTLVTIAAVLTIVGVVTGGIVLMTGESQTLRGDLSVSDFGATAADSAPHLEVDATQLAVDMTATAPADLQRDRSRPKVRKMRRRDAGAAKVRDMFVRPVSKAVVDAALIPRATQGKLLVTYGPWCTLFLDGKKIGTSPMGKALELPPGKHRVRCVDHAGVVRETTAQIIAGQQTTVRDAIRTIDIRLALTRGEALKIEGKFYRGNFSIKPNRYRVGLYGGDKEIEGSYLNLFRACRLVDTPRLKCQ